MVTPEVRTHPRRAKALHFKRTKKYANMNYYWFCRDVEYAVAIDRVTLEIGEGLGAGRRGLPRGGRGVGVGRGYRVTLLVVQAELAGRCQRHDLRGRVVDGRLQGDESGDRILTAMLEGVADRGHRRIAE